MAWTTPGTATAGEVLTAAFWNENVRDNLNVLAPLSAAWTSWTPSRAGFTLGNGTESAKYMLAGKTCCISYRATLGSTSSVSGDIQISLPFPQSTVIYAFGNFQLAGVDYASNITIASNTMFLRVINASGTYATTTNCSATIPATWATGHTIQAAFVYETA